ncbi:hypothetical protein P8452_03688 [Trifolium repens]|nr:hypothetical protein P8452_03688 [Trifolium repens]
MCRDWELTSPWSNVADINVPVKFIIWQILWLTMVEFDVSIDGDSNDVHSTAGNTNEAEDSSYSVSSGQGGSDDDEGNTVRINSMTSEEIRALEFSSVDEAYDFYYKYGKCKGFSVRKSDDKKKNGPDGTKIITNKLFAVRNYRNNELVADFTSKFSEPVLTTQLKKIESHAAEIFTAQIFKDVKDEIMKAGELIEEHVDRIHSSLILSRWTKDAKIAYLNMADVNGSIDSDSIELARFGAYCSVFTAFCKDVSKKEGVYGDIMEDLMNLRNKYCGVEDPIGTQKSDVRDPVPVKVKGAPKRKKNEAKAVRRCTKCNSPSHNARTCSEKKRNKSCNAENSVQTIYSEVPEDRCESSVQKKNKFSEQPKDRGESSFQNKKRRCEQPKDNIESSMPKQKKCSMQRQNRRANVSTPAQTDVTSTVGQLTPMYGFQPMMTYLHPIIQPMDAPHVPPIQPGYQLYGMNVGLLQQVINSADKKD